jgi:hypothetical protein
VKIILERKKMKKVLLMVGCVLLSWNVNALELADVNLPDKVKVWDANLQLNGAGIRTKFFFKVYVAGLYLTQKQTIAENIIADGQVHRVALYFKREMSGEKLLSAFNDAIEANNSPAELSEIDAQLKLMVQIFNAVKEVKQGDVITLDYLPAAGTRISINGVAQQGIIPGPSFNRAVLKIWLGNKPVQDDLKKDLLGG